MCCTNLNESARASALMRDMRHVAAGAPKRSSEGRSMFAALASARAKRFSQLAGGGKFRTAPLPEEFVLARLAAAKVANPGSEQPITVCTSPHAWPP